MNKKSKFSSASLLFEELEPRLLLSADGLAVITESSVATTHELVLGNDEINTLIVQNHTEQSSVVVQAKHQSSELVIIDSRAPNFQQLHNDIIHAQQQGRDIQVVVLDAHRDGIVQISAALTTYHNLDAVHIVSHGESGKLQLGATQLDKQTLKLRSEEIKQWQAAFVDAGDLLLYGCDLASTADGQSLVNELSRQTATDVAASDDLTGSAILGGDWELEYHTGEIESSLAFSGDVQDNWQGTLAAPVANNDSYSVSHNETLVVNALTDNASSADLAAAWQFDEGAGSTTTDATGNGNDGTINGATWTTSSRTGDAALVFDGAGDYVQTTATALDLKTATNFTLSAWFQTDTTTGAHHILWQGVSTGNGWGEPSGYSAATSEMHLSVGRFDANDKITFFMGYTDTVAGAIDITSSSSFTDTGSWHQAVVVVTDLGGGALQADLYVDGVLEGSDTGTQTDRSQWNTDLRIGSPGANQRYFDGAIDEVGIYDRALTPAEISALYKTGIAANDTDADSDTLSAILVTGPGNGSLSLNTDGSFTYTPTAGFSGTDTFTYKVNDGTADSNTATVTIDVTNAAPAFWDYHHTIDLAASTAVADYPIKLELTEGVNGFSHANAQANGEDLRFYDAAGNELSYWIENWNTAGTSTVWVEVANIGSSSIDIYYGNAGVAAASDANAVFSFYDNFENATAGSLPAGWTLAGGANTGTKPSVTDDGGNQVFSDGANNGGPVVGSGNWDDVVVSQDFRTINPGDPINHAGLIARYQDANNMVYGGIVTGNLAQIWYRTTASGGFVKIGGDWDISSYNVDDGNWHNQELKLSGDTVELYIDDTLIGSVSLAATGAPASGQTGFWSQYSNYEAYRDNHIVRDYDAGTGDIVSTVANEGFAIDENSANGTVVGYVIANDPDVTDILTYSITAGNTGSAFAIDNNGLITVNNSAALDFETNPAFSLTIEVSDGVGGTDSDIVLITLNDINEVPTTSLVTLTPIAEDSGARLITQAELLANANDVDGDSLVATGLTIGSGAGNLVNNGDGTWSYTPAANDYTAVTFSYTISDGFLSVAGSASLDITPVNDAPVIDLDADDSSGATGIDYHTTFIEAGGPVKLTDVDLSLIDVDTANLNSITVTLTNELQSGNKESLSANAGATGLTVNWNSSSNVLTISGAGTVADYLSVLSTVTYDNSSNNPNTTDRIITFIADDGTNNSLIASATVSVVQIQKAPVAKNDTFIVDEGSTNILDLAVNDTDQDGDLDPSSIAIVSGPTNGTITAINPDGTVEYVHNGSETLTDSFTYTIRDMIGAVSGTATVTLTVNPVNDAPTVANAIADQVAIEDSAFSFTFAANTFNDFDGDTLTYTSDASGWLSFDAATRTFSGTPLNADVGTTTVTVTANDGNGGTVSDTFDIVIGNTNDAPTVANAIADQVAIEDSAFTFTFAANTFNDIDGDTLTYTSDASGWLSFDAATRTFSGTPLNADVGTTTVTVTANDGNGGTVSDTFDIVISNSNDEPTVANLIPDQVATEDSAFTFTFAANTFNDIDGDTLTYTSDASGWLSFDAATRTFSGTPLNADVGTTTVTVTANDGNGGTVSDTFDIVISNTNDAPAVANLIPDQVAIEDSAFSFTFAANTFNDFDGDTLTYTSDASGWLSFDAATRTFSGTPLNADVGTTTVTVTANDGNGGTVSDTFDIVISNTNDAPTVANLIPDQVATEDSAFTFTFAANTFNDVDGDTLTYTSDASGWLSFDAATRTFSGTPLNADVGTTTVTVTANDGNGGTVSDTFDIVISNTNDAPTVANAIADQVATEDSAFTFTFAANTFNDIDGDTLSYTSDASGWLSFDAATRTFSGTPLNADVGTTTVTVTANDGNGGTVSDTFDIVIGNTNDAPTVANAIADQVAIEDSAFSFTFAANTFDDVDGDTLTYTSDASGWLSFDAATRTFSGTPLNADVGTTTVTVTANDGNGGTVSDTFDIVISNSNDAPTVANLIPDQVATEDSAFTFTFAANTFNDIDGDTLSYTSDASGWLSFDAATRTFSGTPLNADVGTTTVTVTANDGNGGTVSDTFDIVISNTNDAPTVANLIPDQVATEDSAFTFTFAANTFNDIDGDTLTYTSDASGWLSFDAATRTFSGTPLNADVGTTTVTVTANDGNGGTVSDTFDIVISNTNDAPTATNLNAPETYTEDTALNLTNIVVTDVDSTIVTVRLTLSDIAAGSLNTGTSGSVTSTFSSGVWTASGAIVDVNALLAGLTFTPALNYSSNFTIATSVEDDGVVAPTTGIKVMTVIADNDAPTVANLIPDQVATEDSVFSVTFAANTFNDVDGDTLTYTSDASGWLSFDAATRTFSGTPLNGDVGTTTVTVTANDGNGGTVSDTFDIVIGNTNDAPTVANAIADQVATEDGVFSFTFAANTFNDVDGDTLSYTSNASGWLSFDAATRTFRGIPLNADVGTTTVTVTANDGKGGTVSDTFDIVINNTNDAAIIAGVDTGSLTEDLDPDADTLLEVSGALTITDVDTGEANFNAGVLTGSYGNLTIDAAGNWRYEADNTQAAIQNLPASATLTDTISVTSFDGTTHNIVITIGGVNDTPTALNDAPGAVDEGGTAIFDLATNDSDIDNALDLNSIVITAVPSNGSLIVNGDGTVTYSHDGSETVSDSFSYTIADVTGAISNAATVNVTVNPLNDAPSALDDIQTVAEGNSVNIDLAANDVDVDNSLVLNSIVIVGAPVNGTLIVNANGTVDYTHDGSQTLSDSFSYIISDISGAISNVATVNITVIPVNDAPTTIGITDVSVTEDSTATSIDLNAAFDDVDNLDSELTYSITGNTSIGLFTTTAVNAVTGELVLDYSADMNGTSQISIRATDPLGAFVDTLFTVTVTPVNDAPVLVANTGMTAVGTSSAVISNTELSVDDIDNTDTSIVYIVTALPTSGVLMLDGVPVTINSSFTEDDVVNNRLSYQADATGTNDQFAFTVSDSAGGMITANTFNIVVQIVPPVPETPDPEITPVPVVTTTTFDPVDATQPGLGISELEASPTQEIEDWYAGGVTTTRPQPGLTLEPVQHIVLEQAVQDNVRIFENDEVPAESNKLADYSLHTVTSYADMQVRSIKALWVAIDQMKQQIDDNVTEDITQVEFRAAAVSSSGVALTAGIVAWALRSGALMTSLISTIPLWKGYDPLPILTYRDDDDENKSNLTEEKIPTSLEELKKVKALREKMEKYNQVDSMFDNNRAVE